MKLVTRGQWGARAPKSITKLSGANSVTDHWEGPTMGSFGHDKCPILVRGIQNYHMNNNGWSDLAYNAIVCPHGWVFEGRWTGVRSAANGTNAGNGSSYAVCTLRGVGDPFTDEMKVALVEVHTFLKQSTVYPHSKWFNTSCPGPEQKSWIAAGCPTPAIARFSPTDPVPSDQVCAMTYFDADHYYAFARDGGVFAHNVPFHGALGNVRLNAPIAWGGAFADKSGYYLVGEDGGIFAFGSARAIAPYQPLFAEYAAGARRIVDAQVTDFGIVQVSNLGEFYALR